MYCAKLHNTEGTVKTLSQPLGLKTRVTHMSPIHLLIVDDRAPAREGLRALISVIEEPHLDTGCPPIIVIGEACDGTQAMQMVEKLHPDVVLMDVRMPGLSGLDVTRLIRASWPDIGVVLMSFYGVHRADALSVGADSFLLKGCPPEDLLKAIQKAKEKSDSKDSPELMVKSSGGLRIKGD
jgi:DNA-binding NarL/FixJ family response regulator